MAIREVMYRNVPLTLKVAEETSTMLSYKGDRTVRASRRWMIEKAISTSTFHSCTWRYAWFKGKLYRMDGQATSTILCEKPELFPNGLTLSQVYYECDTEEDLARLFRQFDRPESSRTSSECLSAVTKGIRGLTKMPGSFTSAAINGIRAAKAGDNKKAKFLVDDRCDTVYDNASYLRWVYPLMVDGGSILHLAGFQTAMFRTWEVDPDGALDFWNMALEGDKPIGHPTRTLHDLFEDIKSVRRHTRNGECSRAPVWSQRAIHVKASRAWNAFRENDNLFQLQYKPKEAIPDLIM